MRGTNLYSQSFIHVDNGTWHRAELDVGPSAAGVVSRYFATNKLHRNLCSDRKSMRSATPAHDSGLFGRRQRARKTNHTRNLGHRVPQRKSSVFSRRQGTLERHKITGETRGGFLENSFARWRNISLMCFLYTIYISENICSNFYSFPCSRRRLIITMI